MRQESKKKITYCFIDASNLQHSEKWNYRMDYQKLFNYLTKRYGVDRCLYFGSIFVGDYYVLHDYTHNSFVDPNIFNKDYLQREIDILNKKDGQYSKKLQELKKSQDELEFFKQLESIGFEIFLKPLKIMRNGQKKADCDMDIFAKSIIELNNYTNIFLISGDGDFLPMLKYIKSEGKGIEVLSFAKNTAREIKQFVGNSYKNLATLREILEQKIEKHPSN